jgi:peptidoglycan hydrolase-like protein with peptidoglycan-binding domain
MDKNYHVRVCLLAVACVLPSTADAQSARDLFNQTLRQIITNPEKQPQQRSPARNAPRGASAEIAEVQRLLNDAGYSAGTPDGKMGPSTLRAIIGYQRSVGRAPTGRLRMT